MHNKIPILIQASVDRLPLSPAKVESEFMELIDGKIKLVVKGSAKKNPKILLSKGLKPKHKIRLFDTTFYLTDPQTTPELLYVVAYILKGSTLYARILYKDISLIWRCASHCTYIKQELWVGKGDIKTVLDEEYEMTFSDESTTDLPLEMQTAMEHILQQSDKQRGSVADIMSVLQKAPGERVAPYADFRIPRKKANSNPKNLVNKGRSVASFMNPNDPRTLKIVKGFEPDFKKGIIEQSKSSSKLYGGPLKRFRILSVNKKIQ